jgi:hypothetical protein
MKKIILLAIACLIGVGISGCMSNYSEGMAYQYARSLGLTTITTHSISSDANLCGGHLTVAWSNNAGRGGIVCIKNGSITPLQS